jgi:hypothetical protein
MKVAVPLCCAKDIDFYAGGIGIVSSGSELSDGAFQLEVADQFVQEHYRRLFK